MFLVTGKHSAKLCPFINKQCFYCKNKEHIEKVCRKKTAEENVPAHSSNIVTATHQLEGKVCSQFVVLITIQHHQLKLTLK